MYVMMTPIPGRSKERTLSTKRIGLDGSSQNLRWMGENNTEWLHARTSMLVFHGSISTSADDLLHGLYTCCAYILWDLVDVNVIETNSQPVDKRLLVQCKVYEWIAYNFKWPLSDESEITVAIVQKWRKHANWRFGGGGVKSLMWNLYGKYAVWRLYSKLWGAQAQPPLVSLIYHLCRFKLRMQVEQHVWNTIWKKTTMLYIGDAGMQRYYTYIHFLNSYSVLTGIVRFCRIPLTLYLIPASWLLVTITREAHLELRMMRSNWVRK